MRSFFIFLIAVLAPAAARSQSNAPDRDNHFHVAAPTLLWNQSGPGRQLIGFLPVGADIQVENKKKNNWQVRWDEETGIIDAPGGKHAGPPVYPLTAGAAMVRHISKDGRRPGPGDFIFFHVQVRRRDSLIYASRQTSLEPPSVQIPAGGENGDPAQSVVEQVLRQSAAGDSLTILVPLDTAQSRPAAFEDARFMIYDLTVLEVISETEYHAREAQRQQTNATRATEVAGLLSEFVEAYRKGELDGQLERMSSGLQFLILEPGNGPQVETGNLVLVHYYGMLPDGKAFDNSFDRGRPFAFTIGQRKVIRGWEEGLPLLREGSRALLFIPPHLAYGPGGAPPDIPPNAELIFYIEVVKTSPQ